MNKFKQQTDTLVNGMNQNFGDGYKLLFCITRSKTNLPVHEWKEREREREKERR